jgi:hypothetical protein
MFQCLFCKCSTWSWNPSMRYWLGFLWTFLSSLWQLGCPCPSSFRLLPSPLLAPMPFPSLPVRLRTRYVCLPSPKSFRKTFFSCPAFLSPQSHIQARSNQLFPLFLTKMTRFLESPVTQVTAPFLFTLICGLQTLCSHATQAPKENPD